MGSSVISIILALLLGIFIMRWFVNNESHPSTSRINSSTYNNTQQRNSQRLRGQGSGRPAVHVSQSSIQTVQSVAPDLHPEQIRFALQQPGSTVETIVERYLNGETFNFPPNYRPSTSGNNNRTNENSSDPRKVSNIKADNLITKFHIKDDDEFIGVEFNDLDIDERKRYLVWDARRKLKKRLETDEEMASLLK